MPPPATCDAGGGGRAAMRLRYVAGRDAASGVAQAETQSFLARAHANGSFRAAQFPRDPGHGLPARHALQLLQIRRGPEASLRSAHLALPAKDFERRVLARARDHNEAVLRARRAGRARAHIGNGAARGARRRRALADGGASHGGRRRSTNVFTTTDATRPFASLAAARPDPVARERLSCPGLAIPGWKCHIWSIGDQIWHTTKDFR